MTLLDEPPAPAAPEPEPPATPATGWRIDLPNVTVADLRPIKWQLYLSLFGLLLGVLMGLLQAFERNGQTTSTTKSRSSRPTTRG